MLRQLRYTQGAGNIDATDGSVGCIAGDQAVLGFLAPLCHWSEEQLRYLYLEFREIIEMLAGGRVLELQAERGPACNICQVNG